MTKVASISINFNSEIATIECVESLKKLSTDGFTYDVYIIDNKSSRLESTEYVEKHLPKKMPNSTIHFIKTGENLGFAGGNNVGIKDALAHGANYILLLNNDTIVDKNLISELLKAIEKDPKIGIVAPKIYFAPGYEFHKDRYKKSEIGKIFWYAGGAMDWKNVYGKHRGVDEVDNGQYNREELTEFATGCCMLIKREVLEKVGMLDFNYFLYYEENDFCQRVKRAGYKIMFVPNAFLWHKNAQSTGGSGSPLQDYFISRNRMLFGNRFAPFRTKLALFRESLRLLKSGRPWQKKGIQDYYLKRFGKGSFIK